MVSWIDVVACLLWFCYSSFFEWFGHRYVMHVKRFPLRFVYDGHVCIHHLLNRGDSSFNTHGPEGPVNINLRWFSFPFILLIHVPAAYLLQRLTGASTMMAAFVGATVYYAGFEYT